MLHSILKTPKWIEKGSHIYGGNSHTHNTGTHKRQENVLRSTFFKISEHLPNPYLKRSILQLYIAVLTKCNSPWVSQQYIPALPPNHFSAGVIAYRSMSSLTQLFVFQSIMLHTRWEKVNPPQIIVKQNTPTVGPFTLVLMPTQATAHGFMQVKLWREVYTQLGFKETREVICVVPTTPTVMGQVKVWRGFRSWIESLQRKDPL